MNAIRTYKFPLEATISEIHAAMQCGEITCLELVEMYLDRIQRYDRTTPSLKAIILINPWVRAEAAALDKAYKANGFQGPLHGIPVLLKDNFDTENMPTTAGSKSLENVIPSSDGWVVKRLKEAGAIILAKTNLHEFAVWGETVSSILGQTLNPYDLTRTPGGSSGGTGAGIAANFGIIGMGTDTINSVRSPASACSLVGFRPTLGLVSRNGIVPYSLTQDTAGPITRTVEDAVRTLEVIAGYDPSDPLTKLSENHIPDSYSAFLNLNGLQFKRLGVLKSFFGSEEPHFEVNQVMAAAMSYLATGGATLIDLDTVIDANILVSEVSVHLFDLKHDLGHYLQNLGTLTNCHSLEDILASGLYDPGIEENLKTAVTLDVEGIAYQERLRKRLKVQNQVISLFEEHNLDALVYPHQKRLVVTTGSSQIERNGVLSSVTGFPAITVPAGFSHPTDDAPIGVPIGIEFLAQAWDESKLIEIAYAFERISKSRLVPISTP